MILCDIGNSFLHFYQKGKVWKEASDKITQKDPKELILYISVNDNSLESLLYSHPKCFDLAPYLHLDSTYKGLGVDRVAVCKAVSDGVIVDAGSAITIDVMQDDIHLGGYIMPGISLYKKAFSSISALDLEISLSADLDAFPQNTKDALSYGVLKSIILMIENTAKNKRVYFTGGDGKFFSRFFKNSIYNELLIFDGMQKAIFENFTQKGIYL
ncbi:MAG: type III pantothenate kinase [Helicobacter sp.]|nr:type III pantothenate kinase [Helicobacteraceae bacterium]MDY3113963.1 type III pantothenate kinase [Helicobacter sp.]